MGLFSWVIRRAEAVDSQGRWDPSWPSRVLSGEGAEAVLMQQQGWTWLGGGPTAAVGLLQHSGRQGWENHSVIRNHNLGKKWETKGTKPSPPSCAAPRGLLPKGSIQPSWDGVGQALKRPCSKTCHVMVFTQFTSISGKICLDVTSKTSSDPESQELTFVYFYCLTQHWAMKWAKFCCWV